MKKENQCREKHLKDTFMDKTSDGRIVMIVWSCERFGAGQKIRTRRRVRRAVVASELRH